MFIVVVVWGPGQIPLLCLMSILFWPIFHDHYTALRHIMALALIWHKTEDPVFILTFDCHR